MRIIKMLIVDDEDWEAELVAYELQSYINTRKRFETERYVIEYIRVDTEDTLRNVLQVNTFDLVMFDYKMPHLDPRQALAILKEAELDIPLILVSGHVSDEEANMMIREGADDVILKSIIAKATPVVLRELEKADSRDDLIRMFVYGLDLKDHNTGDHSDRVAKLAVELAEVMGLTATEIVHLRWGALLHDVGKIWTPDSILNKQGKLTEDEWVQMKEHPVTAYKLLRMTPFLYRAIEIPYSHHERWDGAGYPQGLRGEDIPLAARIFSVVDVWDALTVDRPYREAWPPDRAMELIVSESGKAFDPHVVTAFAELMRGKNERTENGSGESKKP